MAFHDVARHVVKPLLEVFARIAIQPLEQAGHTNV
jgi:hypothetical protein